MREENTNLQNSENQEYQKRRDNFIQNHLNPLKFKNIKFSKLEDTANKLFLSKISFNFKEDLYSDLTMKYKKDIETQNFFYEKNAKRLSSSPSYWRFNKVEWISKIVNENKEKIYLRDFSKDIIIRYPYRQIYTEKPREDDRNINEILNEYFKENPDKKIYDFFKEKLSISSKELEK